MLQESVGLEDLWQLHWSYNVGLENAPAMFIANVDDAATIAALLTTPPTRHPPARRRTWRPGGPVHLQRRLLPASGPGAPEDQACLAAVVRPGRHRRVRRRWTGPGGPPAHTPAYLIKVTAQQDGTFTVTNTRNGFSKTYRPRP